jgi:hypothetical protein
VGSIAYRVEKASLKRRRLEKPLAKAMSMTGKLVSVRSCLANVNYCIVKSPVDDLMLVADASALIGVEACAASAAGWTENGFFLGSRIPAYIQTAPDQAWSLAEYKRDFCRMRIHDTWHPTFC